jgi:hypothetical protein
MMTSDGRIHLMEETAPTGVQKTVFSTRYPIPDGCDGRKILKAFEKLAYVQRPSPSDAALFPLTPMEKGFVLGALAEYHAKEIK